MSAFDRTQRRTAAKKLYEKFAAQWRYEKRLAGAYGRPRMPKRPRFSQWYALHQHDQEQLEQSSPQDVLEFMGYQDPWKEQLDPRVAQAPEEPKRGVETIQIVGSEED